MNAARRFGRVTTHGALLAAAILLSWTFPGTEGTEASEARRRRQSGLVGVIGPWTTVSDEGPALQIDGTKWRAIDPNDARAAAKATFGAVNDTFVANATSAGAFPIAVWRDIPDFAAGTVRVKFKLVSGESDQTAGIVLGLQPNGEYPVPPLQHARWQSRGVGICERRSPPGRRRHEQDAIAARRLARTGRHPHRHQAHGHTQRGTGVVR